MAVWNPWHGCKKISAGCDNCYVYEKDAMYGKNASVIRRTANFDLPVKKNGEENTSCCHRRNRSMCA